MHYILASASPRRKELLSRYIKEFDVIPADIDETIQPDRPIEAEIIRLAFEKAHFIAVKHPQSVVIAADTVVVLDGKVYGKPRNESDAIAMLKDLRGRTHSVITAVAVDYNGDCVTFADKAFVTFDDYSDTLIDWYVATGEPLDRAGAYAVQELGSILALKSEGDYNTIVGLPLARLMKLLCEKGYYSFM